MLYIDKDEKKVQEQYTRNEEEFRREDPWVNPKPHTIIPLLIMCVVAIYVVFVRDSMKELYTTESNVKIGLIGGCVFFLLFSAAQMKDGLFVRPHPVIWRLIMAVSVLYMFILVFFLFQTVDDARAFLKFIDPSLGKPLPERSYAENCELFTPNDSQSYIRNLRDTVYDEFIIAHLFGWFGKALLLRDYWLCWIMSISFELLEVSLQHMLPNFAECWWDHILLDILICNWLGISLGMRVVNYFKMKHYNFISGRVSHLEPYHWGVLDNWKRLCAVIILMIVVSFSELNAFYLKYVLWIPPPHPINVCRLIIWWGIGMPGTREWYQFVTDPKCKKFGPAAWMCTAIVIIEVIVCVKFGRGMFPKTHPTEVILGWSAFAIGLFIWSIIYFGWYKPRQLKQQKEKKK